MLGAVTLNWRDLDSESARHYFAVERWKDATDDRIVAMARGAPAQQAELTLLAFQTLEKWHELAAETTPLFEAAEHASMAHIAIGSLRDQRLGMVNKPISLAERNPDDPDEMITWSLAEQAFSAIDHLSNVLVGHTQEVHRHLLAMIAKAQKERAAEQEAEAKSSFWKRLRFWED